MGRFIQFAIAASEFALSSESFGAGLKPDPETAERTGVYIGSGIGGFEVIEREHRNLLEKGPSRNLAVVSFPRRLSIWRRDMFRFARARRVRFPATATA